MKKVWITFSSVVILSFIALIWVGTEVYQTQPPIPETVIIKETGEIILTKEDIQIGQNVWESIGGMEVGSIWGHGSYVAPDWSADWIHKEAVFMLNSWAKRDYNTTYENLDVENKAAIKARLIKDIKTNTYNSLTGAITISKDRYKAILDNSKHYAHIFSKGHEQYAIPEGALVDKVKCFFILDFLGSKY